MVDGNNLLFRSYYATAYSGNFMKNSKGFPTNGLYGFVNMINKIINEEKPVYMLVAFDRGRTFRHDLYQNYKADRIEMPDDLKKQFPLAKEILSYMGIKHYEIDDYEADDIIGTFAQYCQADANFYGTIISSDKDLLQLISNEVEVKLLKQKDFIRYTPENFKQEYNISPNNIVDLKALQGDASDNIPGVKGIGEKTALKLLQEYETLDNIYQNIDNISGKIKEKLLQDKENAYLSYQLAQINKNIPVKIKLNDIKVEEKQEEKLLELYRDLEFFSFLKPVNKQVSKVKIINEEKNLPLLKEAAFSLVLEAGNYHESKLLGMAVYATKKNYYVKKDLIAKALAKIDKKLTYDYKKAWVVLKRHNIDLTSVAYDAMLAAYLLDYNVKDDVSYLACQFNYELVCDKETEAPYNAMVKAKFIYETKKHFLDELAKEEMNSLFQEIEMPVARILGMMEFTGVCINKQILNTMGDEIKIKIELLENEIYNLAGVEFNISSPQQLGKILFEKLGLKTGKKTKTGFSTAVDVLEKLRDEHPIIEKLLEYRMLTKLYATYVEGLLEAEKKGRIHTIYQQTLTKTGRLSSVSPNLQNIPIRYEQGRKIRKAFQASNKCVLLTADYSQIELRVLAHIAEVYSLIDAFANDEDIHTKTAQDIFAEEVVTPKMRRIAKAVNFGIIYGMSEYGLAENLNISVKEAKEFIAQYLQTYPEIASYMEKTIAEATESGSVQTLFNRKRNLPELANKNYMIRKQGERFALNTPIQGTAADILKIAMVQIDKRFKEEKIKSKMILQVHDELVFDVLKSELALVQEIVQTEMENATQLKTPLKVTIATGENWFAIK